MKKCNKFILHIYKELDNELSVKDAAELKKHLKSCENCRKEYEFIKSLSKELRESSADVKLPDNFNLILRQRLAEYNLNRDRRVGFYKKIPVNYAVSVCAAIGIIIFAFSYDFNHLKNESINEPVVIEEQTKEQNLSQSNNIPENVNTNMSNEAPALDVSNKVAADNKIKTKVPAALENENNDEANYKPPAEKAEDINEIKTAGNENEDSGIMESGDDKISTQEFLKDDLKGAGGGGSARSEDEVKIALKSSDVSMSLRSVEEETEFLTIIINSESDIIDKIKNYEKISDNEFKINMKDYEYIKELLKDENYEIIGENDESLSKEFFILKLQN